MRIETTRCQPNASKDDIEGLRQRITAAVPIGSGDELFFHGTLG